MTTICENRRRAITRRLENRASTPRSTLLEGGRFCPQYRSAPGNVRGVRRAYHAPGIPWSGGPHISASAFDGRICLFRHIANGVGVGANECENPETVAVSGLFMAEKEGFELRN